MLTNACSRCRAEHPDVVSVFPNQVKKLHTTHSWDFLMMENGGVIPPSSVWSKARYGKDIIIGNLDTGFPIYPLLQI